MCHLTSPVVHLAVFTAAPEGGRNDRNLSQEARYEGRATRFGCRGDMRVDRPNGRRSPRSAAGRRWLSHGVEPEFHGAWPHDGWELKRQRSREHGRDAQSLLARAVLRPLTTSWASCRNCFQYGAQHPLTRSDSWELPPASRRACNGRCRCRHCRRSGWTAAHEWPRGCKPSLGGRHLYPRLAPRSGVQSSRADYLG